MDLQLQALECIVSIPVPAMIILVNDHDHTPLSDKD